MINYFFILLATTGVSITQVGFKWRLNRLAISNEGTASLFELLKSIIFDGWFWLLGILLVCSAGLWYFSLTKVNLSVAYPIVALSYPIVIIFSSVMLKEPIVNLHYLGSAVIVVGVIMIGYAGLQKP